MYILKALEANSGSIKEIILFETYNINSLQRTPNIPQQSNHPVDET